MNLMIIISVCIVALFMQVSLKKWKLIGQQFGIVWRATGGLIGFLLALPIVMLGFLYGVFKGIYK